jgi:hypothetical protein
MRTKRKTKKQNTRQKHKGGKSLKKLNCSPKPKDKLNHFSCYANDSLVLLRNKWNSRHPDVKIHSDNPKEIHSQLKTHLQNVCNTEACWLKRNTDFGKLESDLSDSFAPESPLDWAKNPNEWLSSNDIHRVMKQYEKAYICFDFIGPTPIDFDSKEVDGECVWEELCHFNLEKQMKRGKTKIGVIFNTDTHDKPGQHWISMFVNIKKRRIFFFDSTGDPPPKEVVKLMQKIKRQGQAMTPKLHFKIDSNEGVEHQYGNTECGMYSLFFIIHMLEDKLTEHYLKTHIFKDEYMQKYRKIYFNEHSSLL